MRKRREFEVFSLSFLDCICCGFGAIILLFVLTVGPIKRVVQASEQGALEFIQILELQLNQTQDQLSRTTARIGEYSAQSGETVAAAEVRDALMSVDRQLLATRQAIEATDKKIQAQRERKAQMKTPLKPVGITAESDHLVFLVDTSGSMRGPVGLLNPMVIRQVEAILASYPEVKALQILDCNGRYILPGSRGAWLADTPGERQHILQALLQYRETSVSNPVPGLMAVFKDYSPLKNKDKKIGIYIFGDEFPGTANDVLKAMDAINPIDPVTKKRAIAINAVGFPFRIGHNPSPSDTGFKFANLMRELAYRHDGTFIIAE